LPTGWSLRSAEVAGRDTLDVPLEVRLGESLANMTVTLTNRPTELSGTVVNAVGQPTSEHSMVAFSTVTASSTELFVIFALMLSGMGMGATAPAMATAIANLVDNRDLGVAGGAEQMFSQLGVVVGTQVMITVQQSAADNTNATSYAHGYLVGGCVAALGVVCASFVRRTVPRRDRRDRRASDPVLVDAV